MVGLVSRGRYQEIEIYWIKFTGTDLLWPQCRGGSQWLSRQNVFDSCVNSDLLRSVFQLGSVAVIRW